MYKRQLFIQGVLQQPATNSGLVTTPLVLTMAVGAILVGQVVARLGRYQVIAIIGAAAFEIFALVVLFRFLTVVWHWLGVQDVALTDRGQQLQANNPSLVGQQAAATSRWNAFLGAVYLFVAGSIVVTGLFALNQPVAWLMLTVLGILFLILVGIIIFNP